MHPLSCFDVFSGAFDCFYCADELPREAFIAPTMTCPSLRRIMHLGFGRSKVKHTNPLAIVLDLPLAPINSSSPFALLLCLSYHVEKGRLSTPAPESFMAIFTFQWIVLPGHGNHLVIAHIIVAF
ncbi:MAG: hypothetical protein Q9183_005319, partial [Haloplaca sp. 2 TL-2023]